MPNWSIVLHVVLTRPRRWNPWSIAVFAARRFDTTQAEKVLSKLASACRSAPDDGDPARCLSWQTRSPPPGPCGNGLAHTSRSLFAFPGWPAWRPAGLRAPPSAHLAAPSAQLAKVDAGEGLALAEVAHRVRLGHAEGPSGAGRPDDFAEPAAERRQVQVAFRQPTMDRLFASRAHRRERDLDRRRLRPVSSRNSRSAVASSDSAGSGKPLGIDQPAASAPSRRGRPDGQAAPRAPKARNDKRGGPALTWAMDALCCSGNCNTRLDPDQRPIRSARQNGGVACGGRVEPGG